MTSEERHTVEEMYYEARWGQVRVALYDCPRSDLIENQERWQALTDFRKAHGVGDNEYWRIIIRVEERVYARAKEIHERMYRHAGRRHPTCCAEELASLMGYPRLPFYPWNISMLVALAFRCEWDNRV